MVRLWNRLPRKVVDVPSQLVFKARLDKSLSNLIQWEVSLPLAWGLGTSRSLRSFPTPLTFYDQGSSLLQKLYFLSLQQEHANWKILPMSEAYRSFAIMITFITMRGTLITTWQGKIKSCWGKKIWEKQEAIILLSNSHFERNKKPYSIKKLSELSTLLKHPFSTLCMAASGQQLKKSNIYGTFSWH